MTRESVQLDRYCYASYTRSSLPVSLCWLRNAAFLQTELFQSPVCCCCLVVADSRERKLTCQLTSRLAQNSAHSRMLPTPLPSEYWLLFQRTLMRLLIQLRRFISHAPRSAKWPKRGSRSRSFPWPMEAWASDWLILPWLPRSWHAWMSTSPRRCWPVDWDSSPSFNAVMRPNASCSSNPSSMTRMGTCSLHLPLLRWVAVQISTPLMLKRGCRPLPVAMGMGGWSPGKNTTPSMVLAGTAQEPISTASSAGPTRPEHANRWQW